MGIPDEESWFQRRYLPTGHASGWRRPVIIGITALLIAGLVLGVVVGFVAMLR